MTSLNLVGVHLLSLYYVLNPTLNLWYVVSLPLGLQCFMLSHHPSLHFIFQTNCDMNFVLWFSFLFLHFSLIIIFGLSMGLGTNCELLLFVLLELCALVFSRTLALSFYISLCYVFHLDTNCECLCCSSFLFWFSSRLLWFTIMSFYFVFWFTLFMNSFCLCC
jgi:hypothetical protein